MFNDLLSKQDDNFYHGILKVNDQAIYVDKEIFLIGRGKSCNLILSHPSVSKEQAAIECEKGVVNLRDLNSSNGCIINDVKLKDGSTKQLNNNDRIKFGKDPTIYIYEAKSILHNLQNSTEIDNTIVFQSTIKDDKISLVNEEFYSKATRNHLEKKLVVNNQDNFKSGKISHQYDLNLPQLTKASLKSNKTLNNSDSPKFNDLTHERTQEKMSHELDLTFKHSKKSNMDDDNIKYINEIMLQFEKLKKENENFEKKCLELEEKLMEKTNETTKVLNKLDQLSEEHGKLNAKHNALLIYASEIQKKLDIGDFELKEKKLELNNLLMCDWGKLLSEKESLIKILQYEIKYNREELNKQKTLTGGYKNNDSNSRLEKLIDTYLQENKKYKKINEEYKSRENECNKKWNELLKENRTNIEKINILQIQLDRQSGQIANLISEYDMRVVDALNKIPKFLEEFDEKKSEAAEYLVEQTNNLLEENGNLIQANIILENRLGMIGLENERLSEDNRNLLNYFEYNEQNDYDTQGDNDNNGNFNVNVKILFKKLEELEDVLTQYKNTHSPNKSIDMEEKFLEYNIKIADRENQIDDLKRTLQEYIIKTKLYFDESEAIESISNALSQRDMIIANLRSQVKELSNVKINESDRIFDKLNDQSRAFGNFSERNFNASNFIEKIETVS